LGSILAGFRGSATFSRSSSSSAAYLLKQLRFRAPAIATWRRTHRLPLSRPACPYQRIPPVCGGGGGGGGGECGGGGSGGDLSNMVSNEAEGSVIHNAPPLLSAPQVYSKHSELLPYPFLQIDEVPFGSYSVHHSLRTSLLYFKPYQLCYRALKGHSVLIHVQWRSGSEMALH
jgi:hypothetical protein